MVEFHWHWSWVVLLLLATFALVWLLYNGFMSDIKDALQASANSPPEEAEEKCEEKSREEP